MIAYHIDRTSSLKEGDIINLQVFNDISPPLLNEILNTKYPQGLSCHGDAYYASKANLNNLNDYLLETFFEYERLLNFPNTISRLQSFFASESLGECISWINIFNLENNYSIWKVEFNHHNYLKLDASWLAFGINDFSSLATTYFANKYWSGEISTNPKMELLIKPPIRIIQRVEV